MLHHKIGRRIFITLLFVSLVPTFIFVSYQIKKNYESNRSFVIKKLESKNEAVANSISSYFNEISSKLIIYSKNDYLLNLAEGINKNNKHKIGYWKGRTSDVFKPLTEINGGSIKFVNFNEKEIISFSFRDKIYTKLEKQKLKDINNIRSYLQKKEIYVSNFQSRIKIASLVKNNNKKINGILIAEFPSANITDKIKDNYMTFIIDEKNNCIGPKEEFLYKPSKQEYEKFISEENGILDKDNLNYLAYNTIKLPSRKNWILLQLINKNDLFSSADKNKKTSVVILIIGLIFVVFIVMFISKKLFKPIHLASDYDGLTLAYNRRYFNELLNIEIKKSKKNMKEFSTALLDIDYFKKINDKYGHQIGDFVLRKIVEIVKEKLRKSDIIARYGGEEFVIILSQCNKNNAFELLERLRKTIMDYNFSVDENISFKITVSIGIAEYPNDGKNAKQLIEKADFLLYLAKNYGRNQVQK